MPPDLAPLLQLGAVGCTLAFVLVRLEARLRSVEDAQDRQTRALLLLTLANNNLTPRMRREAEALAEEVQAAEKERRR